MPNGGAGWADTPSDSPHPWQAVYRCSKPSRTHALRAPLRGAFALHWPPLRAVATGGRRDGRRPDSLPSLRRIEQEIGSTRNLNQHLCHKNVSRSGKGMITASTCRGTHKFLHWQRALAQEEGIASVVMQTTLRWNGTRTSWLRTTLGAGSIDLAVNC